jgi:hypothetical protein
MDSTCSRIFEDLTKKEAWMLNRLAITSFSLLLALSAYACGDDDSGDGGTTPDSGGGGTADAGGGGDTPDAAAGDTLDLTDSEGGQILFEYINVDSDLQAAFGLPAGATTIMRNMAYFVSSQTPELNALPVNLAPEDDGCANLYETKGWPLGPPNGINGEPRTEVDVGNLVFTGKNTAGDDVENVVEKATAETHTAPYPFPLDSWGRTHDVYYEFIPPNADQFQAADSLYTITMTGSADYPETTYENIAYMPGAVQFTTPDLEDDDIGLNTTDTVTVEWEAPVQPNQNVPDASKLVGGALLTAVVLGDTTGAPVMFCVVPAAQGSFDITGRTVQRFRDSVSASGGDPDHAILLRNNIAHTLGWFNNGDGTKPYDPNDQRRVDILSVWCGAQVVNVGP